MSKRPQEPRGDLARYAFGYSDKKPGRAWWIINGGMVAFVLYHMFRVCP